jgi:hypothetical protein
MDATAKREVLDLAAMNPGHSAHVLVWSKLLHWTMGTRDSVVVEALCYKQEGRGFVTR